MAVIRMTFFSTTLKMTTNCNILIPDNSNDVTPICNGQYKTLYLLHGLSGNAEEWIRFTKLEYYAKKFGYIIVMPEVGRSFYTNIDGINYAKYIAEELPNYLSQWFKIPTQKQCTYIAGESMGGYGALKIGFSYPKQYQSIAALSPVIHLEELRCMVENKVFEEMGVDEIDRIMYQNDYFDIYKYLDNKPSKDYPSVIQLCGTDDFLIDSNRKFYHYAKNKMDITYRELSGDHEWPVWDIAIQKALQYFEKYDIDHFKLY